MMVLKCSMMLLMISITGVKEKVYKVNLHANKQDMFHNHLIILYQNILSFSILELVNYLYPFLEEKMRFVTSSPTIIWIYKSSESSHQVQAHQEQTHTLVEQMPKKK
eukprot:7547179-Ditylum_brightwellii.AAC.1